MTFVGEVAHRRLQVERPIERPKREEGALRASIVQEDMFPHLLQNAALSQAYTVLSVDTVSGPFELARFREAVVSVMERHRSLRTRLVMVEDKLLQLVDGVPSDPVEFFALGVAKRPRDEAIRAMLQEYVASNPINLRRGYPLRCAIFQVSPNEHVLLFMIHHLFFDGWSRGILWRDIASHYNEKADSGQPGSADTFQFSDFSTWQRTWVESQDAEPQHNYWSGVLDGAPEGAAMPGDLHPPSDEVGRVGGLYSWALPAGVSNVVMKMASAGVASSVAAVLLSGFQMLLARETGSMDISVGVPMANRGRPPTREAIGFFVNTYVLRAEFGNNRRADQVLADVSHALSRANANDEVPLGATIRRAFAKGISMRLPENLIQTMFVCHSFRRKPPLLSGIDIGPRLLLEQPPMNSFTLEVSFIGREIVCHMTYDKALFTGDRVRLLSQQYEACLRELSFLNCALSI